MHVDYNREDYKELEKLAFFLRERIIKLYLNYFMHALKCQDNSLS